MDSKRENGQFIYLVLSKERLVKIKADGDEYYHISPVQFDESEINKNHFMKGWGKSIFST